MSNALLQELIQALQVLPGVGPRGSQRIAVKLLGRDRAGGFRLQQVLQEALTIIGECRRCRMYSEHELCQLCSDSGRDARIVCVVESPLDLLAIEKTGTYRGLYFVLHGRLSPLDGIGPGEIGVTALVAMVREQRAEEVILATNFTIEGETTAQFLSEVLGAEVRMTRIAQGVPLGGELEFVDDSTLAQALSERRVLDS